MSTLELARKVAEANPEKRVAVAKNDSGIAIWDETKSAFAPVIEKTIMGTFVYAGVNTQREWIEL